MLTDEDVVIAPAPAKFADPAPSPFFQKLMRDVHARMVPLCRTMVREWVSKHYGNKLERSSRDNLKVQVQDVKDLSFEFPPEVELQDKEARAKLVMSYAHICAARVFDRIAASVGPAVDALPEEERPGDLRSALLEVPWSEDRDVFFKSLLRAVVRKFKVPESGAFVELRERARSLFELLFRRRDEFGLGKGRSVLVLVELWHDPERVPSVGVTRVDAEPLAQAREESRVRSQPPEEPEPQSLIKAPKTFRGLDLSVPWLGVFDQAKTIRAAPAQEALAVAWLEYRKPPASGPLNDRVWVHKFIANDPPAVKGEWFYVRTESGEEGYVSKFGVHWNPPDPLATLYKIGGESAYDLAKKFYPGSERDLRDYVLILLLANHGEGNNESGIYTPSPAVVEAKTPWGVTKQKVEWGDLDFWQAVQTRGGRWMWVPSEEYAASLRRMIPTSSRKEKHLLRPWRELKEVAAMIPGFTLGLGHGIAVTLWENAKALLDLLGLVKDLLTGELVRNVIKLWEWASKREAKEILVELFGDVQTKWDQENDFERARFRGYVIGRVVTEIVLMFVSLGALAVAKLGKWRKVQQALEALGLGGLFKKAEELEKVAPDEFKAKAHGDQPKAGKGHLDEPAAPRRRTGAGDGTGSPEVPRVKGPTAPTAAKQAELKVVRKKYVAVLKNDKARLARIKTGDAGEVRRLVNDFVDRGGTWKELSKELADEKLDDVAKAVNEFREKKVADVVKEKFGAEPTGTRKGMRNDLDMSTTGPNAGRKLIEAEKYMETTWGPNWRKKFDMTIFVDPRRAHIYDELKLARKIPDGDMARLEGRLTREAERLEFLKLVEGASPEDIPRLRALAKKLGVNFSDVEQRLAQLRKLDTTARKKIREKLLREGDDLARQYKDKPSLELAEAIAKKQMEANLMTEGAYIGPGAVKETVSIKEGFISKARRLSPHEVYQSVLSDVRSFEHVITESKSVVDAARRYELWKYADRLMKAAHDNNFDLAVKHMPEMGALKVLSRKVYEAHQSGKVLAVQEVLRDLPAVQAKLGKYVEFIRHGYDSFLPELQARAAKAAGK